MCTHVSEIKLHFMLSLHGKSYGLNLQKIKWYIYYNICQCKSKITSIYFLKVLGLELNVYELYLFSIFFSFLTYRYWELNMYQELIWVFCKDCFISYKTIMRYVFSLSYLYSVITEVLSSLQFIGSHKNLHFKGINTHKQIWVLYFAKYKDSAHCVAFIHSYHWLTAIPNSRKPQFSYSSVQFSSIAQSCPTLCDPMNPSVSGLPIHHQLPEFTQTHVHRVGDGIQPSHPLPSPSPPAPNPSQHQSLFQGVNSSHKVAKVLEFQF